MNRLMITILALVFIFATAGTGMAQNQPSAADQQDGQRGCPMMMKKGAQGKQMGCPGCPMAGGMRGKDLVAAQDGGFVVLAGDRLIKYDKDLNLVKEVELPMSDYMKEMMKAHHPDMYKKNKSEQAE